MALGHLACPTEGVCLMEEQPMIPLEQIDPKVVEQAIKDLNINAEKADPIHA